MTPLVLRTGQRTCHDVEYTRGLAWPDPRFQAQGPLVLDRLSALVWTRNAALAEFPLTWDEALAFIARINQDQYCGYEDWRLPNRRELRSLISHQTRRPALVEDHPFEQVFCSWYWSSTTAVINPAHAWYVDLDGGRMFFGGKDQSCMVWPVLGRRPILPKTGQFLS